ncbi:WYL domain-containing protein [Lactococcus lactis]|uniref:helix-turn-helix transcriptional regulator n=1 Tax=Lactococcus lactis TaxID=1358 RepID=UPI001F391039|nr:WYL domain-containing protein [Lactococcus lactis]MCG1001719.1 WYL domain-containing protein [Lactococcus lactis]
MNKSTRLNQEIIFLNTKNYFNLKDLMKEFNISKRTALRDISELETLGVPIYSEIGCYGGYHIIDNKLLLPLYFNYEEITSIFFALKALEKLYINPFQHSYTSITKKLMANLTPQQKIAVNNSLNVTHYYNSSSLGSARFLPEILDSIIKEKQVEIIYSQYIIQTIQVQFFDLFYREGVWFTHAINIQNKEWGIYRCDFISSFKIKQKQSTFSRQKLTLLLEEHEQTFRNIFFKCEITEFGKELFHKNHYETMIIESLNDKSYLSGYYNKNEINYLVHYLIEYGEHLTIIEPEELKTMYIKSLHKILQRYQ